jgi:2-keto-3-deoxy-L-fuconate dehydrogenase
MGDRLAGRVAVVTAAGQGIGRAIAQTFAAEGATVHASDIDEAKLQDLSGCKLARLDVMSTPEVARYAEALGPVDVLVNVAGFVHHGTVLDATEADWDYSFDLNVKSMHRTIRAFLPAMLRAAPDQVLSRSIINMSSCASSLKGIPNRYVYGATKAAIIGMTKAVAIDFISQGIRCNAICPGPIQTPSWNERVSSLSEALGSKEEALNVYLTKQPSGRVGEAAEVAALAVYLASDESAFMTGAALPLDGGLTL